MNVFTIDELREIEGRQMDDVGHAVFSRRDGKLWIDQADPKILVSLELIVNHDRECVDVDHRTLRFRAANGEVRYEITSWDPSVGALVCHRITDWPTP